MFFPCTMSTSPPCHILYISNKELAARIQIAGIPLERDSISRVEIGTRFVADFELKVFAEVLGVSVESLLAEI